MTEIETTFTLSGFPRKMTMKLLLIALLVASLSAKPKWSLIEVEDEAGVEDKWKAEDQNDGSDTPLVVGGGWWVMSLSGTVVSRRRALRRRNSHPYHPVIMQLHPAWPHILFAGIQVSQMCHFYLWRKDESVFWFWQRALKAHSA